MTTYIAYIRTSTEGQQNGLEAQQSAIDAFICSTGGQVLETYTEQVSGAKDNRTELQRAIKACKKHGATLLVSKLDRLSRKVSFIANLMETKIDLTVCAMPSASTFQLHLFACLAEEERRWISERTKAALAVKKAQGVKLGSPLNAVRANEAKQFAHKMKPVFDDLKAQGIKSLNAIARTLNEQGVDTFAGGKWYPATVKNTLGYLA